FAVLGSEEGCTGDPAKRAGNEFLFQMQAMTNIEVLDGYEVQRIVTHCPHCFNTIGNEYPLLGGNYEVMHHTKFLKTLMEEGRLKVEGGKFKGKRITFHDPCYLGRANGEYEAPRDLLKKLEVELVEMRRCKSNALCCGAGGETTEAMIVVTGRTFYNTMMTDGEKGIKREGDMQVLDIVEMIANAEDL